MVYASMINYQSVVAQIASLVQESERNLERMILVMNAYRDVESPQTLAIPADHGRQS